MLKKIISLLLALCLLWSFSAISVAKEADTGILENFKDYEIVCGDELHWCYEPILELVKAKVVLGSNGSLLPNKPLTRAEFVSLLSRFATVTGMVEAEEISSSAMYGFRDIEPGAWYAASVNWAANKGLVLGVGKDLFKPDGYLTFEQMQTLLYRFVREYDLNLGDPVRFIDYTGISPWAVEGIHFFDSRELWEGYPGQYHPQGRVSRADSIFLLFKTARRSGLLAETPEASNQPLLP